MTVVTAAAVHDGALAPTMDRLAVTLDISELIHRPQTPAADSVVEVFEIQMAAMLEMAKLIGKVADANGVALDLDRKVAGWADQVTAALRHEERNATPGQTTTGRDIAHELAPILDAHLAGDTAAAARIARIVRHIPRDVLMRPAVTHHLAKRRTRALVSILDRLPQR